MKKIVFSLLISICFLLSCKKEGNSYSDKVERVRVNFFLNVNPNHSLTPFFQSNHHIGTDTWEPLLFPMKRFEYKPGFIYDLLAVRRNTPMPASPGAVAYKLIKVVSIEKVANDVPFTVYLKGISKSYVTGDINKGYQLLNQIDIDCNSYCAALENALKKDNNLKGTFIRNENGSFKLVGLTPTP